MQKYCKFACIERFQSYKKRFVQSVFCYFQPVTWHMQTYYNRIWIAQFRYYRKVDVYSYKMNFYLLALQLYLKKAKKKSVIFTHQLLTPNKFHSCIMRLNDGIKQPEKKRKFVSNESRSFSRMWYKYLNMAGYCGVFVFPKAIWNLLHTESISNEGSHWTRHWLFAVFKTSRNFQTLWTLSIGTSFLSKTDTSFSPNNKESTGKVEKWGGGRGGN